MLEKPLASLVQANIVALLENKVIEQTTLDYKRDLPSTEDARRDTLYDIASLANGRGGDIVFGVDEERDAAGKPTGLPREIVGVGNVNLDDAKMRLNQMVESCTKPRISGVDFAVIEGFAQGSVVVLRVPPSWNGPHMVHVGSSQRFYGRSASGKFQMDIDQIRAAILASASLPERLESLRRDRTARIAADAGQIPLAPGPRLVLHIVPFASLARPLRIEPAMLMNLAMPTVSVSGGGNTRVNFDGYLMASQGNGRTDGYVQAFRSGYIESVKSLFDDGRPPVIGSKWIERTLIEAVIGASRGLPTVGAPPPYYVGVTLIGVKSAYLATSNSQQVGPFDRDVLFLPEVQIDDTSLALQEVARALRPAVDAMWHSTGALGSPNFDPAGVWRY